MQHIFLKTERLILSYITQHDFAELKSILQDKDVMYAWEHDFTDMDVQAWIDKNIQMYVEYNLGYFLLCEKASNTVIGQAALMPDIIKGTQYHEIGYILKKEFWHKGYAREAARALKEYAFQVLQLQEVIFEIRPNNLASRKVAESLHAKICGEFVKSFKNKKMTHLMYTLSKTEKM